MAFFYWDTDAAGDTNDGTTWANAKKSLEAAFGVMSAGDILIAQGAAVDTAAVTRTLTSPGTVTNPCKIIGVNDGTTNTGTNIVTSDLLERGIDTLVHVEVTGNGNDLLFVGTCSVHGIKFTIPDRLQINSQSSTWEYHQCEIALSFALQLIEGTMTLYNCELEAVLTSFIFYTRDSFVEQPFKMYGGVFTFTANPPTLFHSSLSDAGVIFQGVDLSGFGNNNILGTGNTGTFIFKNCKVPTTFNLSSGNLVNRECRIIMISCTNDTTIGATASIQDYKYRDPYGDIVNEATIVRTGGATDSASGLFSYALTPNANAVLESSLANLASPWLSVWVAGGANTLTVYIANSSASTDYNEDEVWCEFYTPDTADTAQHDQTFDPLLPRLINSTTILTDDTGSTWGTGGNNHQKFSITLTGGFEGIAYARVHLAKRQATPDTLYLDPKIAVT